MKKLSILVLAFAFMLVFSIGIMAEDTLWPNNAGTDPIGNAGWEIDVGTLEGWTDSNFEILEYQASGKSEVVGTGITVDGIKVEWDYPSSGIGKGGEFEDDFVQSIDYTIVAFAEIPCVLKMNVFGNGGWADGISIGGVSEIDIDNGLYMSDDDDEEVAPGNRSHFMIFDTNYGGVVDEDWEFVDMEAIGAEGYATGDAPGLYIHACDLWTADIWANVPYGFAISSTGLGDFAGLADPFYIDMRYLERVGAGIVSSNSGLPPVFEYDNGEFDWSEDFVVNEDGVEIGTYEAGQNAHINMQFRIPVTGAPAGRYQGEVTFSTYTI